MDDLIALHGERSRVCEHCVVEHDSLVFRGTGIGRYCPIRRDSDHLHAIIGRVTEIAARVLAIGSRWPTYSSRYDVRLQSPRTQQGILVHKPQSLAVGAPAERDERAQRAIAQIQSRP